MRVEYDFCLLLGKHEIVLKKLETSSCELHDDVVHAMKKYIKDYSACLNSYLKLNETMNCSIFTRLIALPIWFPKFIWKTYVYHKLNSQHFSSQAEMMTVCEHHNISFDEIWSQLVIDSFKNNDVKRSDN